jgi:hypothetical protein
MKPVECEFEAEILASVLQGRWPEGIEAHLRAHVAGCAICPEVVTIAGEIHNSREELRQRAVLPEAGAVWWRAQLRARREAAEVAARPMTVAQVTAFACAVGLLGACFGATSTWFQSVLGKITSGLANLKLETHLAAALALLADHAGLVFAMVAVLLLVPAAACLAILRE